MSGVDVVALRVAAEAATPGLWHWDSWKPRNGQPATACVTEGPHDIATLNGSNVAPPYDPDETLDEEALDLRWREERILAAERDAAFIAAANPAVVLALLDRIDALESQVESVEDLNDLALAHLDAAREDIAEERARVSELEAVVERAETLALGWAMWSEMHATAPEVARFHECATALHGLLASSRAAQGDDGGVVAESPTDDANEAHAGCEHEWSQRGDKADPWARCNSCGEVRNGRVK